MLSLVGIFTLNFNPGVFLFLHAKIFFNSFESIIRINLKPFLYFYFNSLNECNDAINAPINGFLPAPLIESSLQASKYLILRYIQINLLSNKVFQCFVIVFNFFIRNLFKHFKILYSMYRLISMHRI